MLFVRLASGFAALLLASGTALAQGAKLNDPQIAHIAYTAGQLDIEAARQALQKSNNKDVIAFAQGSSRIFQIRTLANKTVRYLEEIHARSRLRQKTASDILPTTKSAMV